MSLTLATAVILGSKIHKAIYSDIRQEMQKHDVYVDCAVVVIIDINYPFSDYLLIFVLLVRIVYIYIYIVVYTFFFNGLVLF